MGLRQWKLQDAKNHFSEVVESAMKDGPQEVTKHGEPAVVILSSALYQELNNLKKILWIFLKTLRFMAWNWI